MNFRAMNSVFAKFTLAFSDGTITSEISDQSSQLRSEITIETTTETDQVAAGNNAIPLTIITILIFGIIGIIAYFGTKSTSAKTSKKTTGYGITDKQDLIRKTPFACAACGTKVEKESLFCMECGSKI